jgi:hypothetical protein
MGMYSDWVARNPGKSDKQAVNVEFVLKEIDNTKTILTDAVESQTLPATTNTLITTLLQTIRNNLKWLISKKQNKIDYADFNGTGMPRQNQTIYKKSNGIEWIKKSTDSGKYYVKFNRNASNIRIVGSATTDTDYQSEVYYHNILHFMQGRYDPSDDTVCISVCNKDGVQTDAAIIKICAFDT